MKSNKFRLTYLLVVVFFSFFTFLHAQDSKLPQITTDAYYAEKIYLQLSSTVFTNSQTIWFKAIVTDVNNRPSKISNILHVELIDFDSNIIEEKVLKLQNGIAHNSFELNRKYKEGSYLIRAYTKWNRNFNTKDFISRTYIKIYADENSLEKRDVIHNVTLTEKETDHYELSARVSPNRLQPKYNGKLLLYINTDAKKDSIEVTKREGMYKFSYILPKGTQKANLLLKLKKQNFTFDERYSKTIVVNKKYLDLQFFPEGGDLVNGLISKMGFKAINFQNKGVAVKGFIVNENDSIITSFSSNVLGMGTFMLKPKFNERYYGKIINEDGSIYKYPLPNVKLKGYNLKCNIKESHLMLKVTSNKDFEEMLDIRVYAKGVEYEDFYFKLENGSYTMAINKSTLPTGIIKVTLYNTSKQILCERLIFNDSELSSIKIEASTHLKSYEQRDKVFVNIKAKEHEEHPINPTSISVLVIDKAQLGEMHQLRPNILSALLLNSELRGKIEQPSFYFNKKNKTRKSDLDALLITQGWRNYKYSPTQASSKFLFNPEKNLSITGSIGEYLNIQNKPKAPLELTLMVSGDRKDFSKQKIDSLGRFNFQLGDIYNEKINVLLQTKTKKGKLKNYTINVDKPFIPRIDFEQEPNIQVPDSINTFIEQRILNNSTKTKDTDYRFKLEDKTIVLDAVNLTGYKLTPQREKMMNTFGPPDVVIDGEDLLEKEEDWSSGLLSVLHFNFADEIQVVEMDEFFSVDLGKSLSVERNGLQTRELQARGLTYEDYTGSYKKLKVYSRDHTYVFVDGIPVRDEDYPFIMALPTKEIKSVELLNDPKVKASFLTEVYGNFTVQQLTRNSVAIVSIYTHAGNGINGLNKLKGIFKDKIRGFAPVQEFYAPKHDNLSDIDWEIPDLRAVIHWNPEVKINDKGIAVDEFYNSDTTGNMLIIVEAISNNGKLGYHEITYQVEEKANK